MLSNGSVQSPVKPLPELSQGHMPIASNRANLLYINSDVFLEFLNFLNFSDGMKLHRSSKLLTDPAISATVNQLLNRAYGKDVRAVLASHFIDADLLFSNCGRGSVLISGKLLCRRCFQGNGKRQKSIYMYIMIHTRIYLEIMGFESSIMIAGLLMRHYCV